jgi:predicted nucleic acid-binding Zn ribbon protein
MIKEYKCALCGHVQDEWRPTSAMPEFVMCKRCVGASYPIEKIYPTSVVFKGGGWTPTGNPAVLDLGGDDDERV